MSNRPAWGRQNGAQKEPRPVRAPRGIQMACKGWAQESAMRLLMNGLDPEVAEQPQDLASRGGEGQPIPDRTSYHSIVRALKNLPNDETLLVRSGKPIGTFRTHEQAPRVLIANTDRPGRGPTREGIREPELYGLVLHGQISAGSWLRVGAQGILQGTFGTYAAAAQKHYGGDLAGKLVVAGGMGRMGGAQPLAATMNGAAFLGIDVDPERIKRRIRDGYCDICVNDLDEALRILKNAVRKKEAISVGLVGNCAEIIPEMARRGIVPDLLTDQTPAHDPLNGYVPAGLSLEEASDLRRSDPDEYRERSCDSIARHVVGMLELQKLGAPTFAYGNNIRAIARERGVKDAYNFPDFVSAYIQPHLSEGRRPVCWVALSGEAKDIFRVDDLVVELFPGDAILGRWTRGARRSVKFQGLPARICWLGNEKRALFAERLNGLVARGELMGPVAIGYERFDWATASSALQERDATKAGSDVMADLPALKRLLDLAAGASWVSVQRSGDAGPGYSVHATLVVVADGTPEAAKRLRHVLTDASDAETAQDAGVGHPDSN